MSKFLITGGAGFIGTNLAYFLVEHGHQVRLLDNLSTGNLSNLRFIRKKVDLPVEVSQASE